MKILEPTETIELIDSLLKHTDKEVLAEWASLSESDKVKVLINLNEVRIYGERNLYRSIKQIMPDNYSLMPITAFFLAWDIKDLKSVGEVKEHFKKKKIPIRDNFTFSTVKPSIVNSIDILFKVFLAVSYNDAYNYIQVANILKSINQDRASQYIKDIKVSHANISGLISWYRMAQSFDEARNLAGFDQEKEPVSYPSPEEVFKIINTTVDLFKEIGLFVTPILKSLSETTNLISLFVTIDAVLMALTTKITPDYMVLRRKLAFYYILRDFVDDTGGWVLYQQQLLVKQESS